MARRRDVFSKAKRSWVMSRIGSRNTKLDLSMKRLLVDAKIPFTIYPDILGHPDFLLGTNVALFCDSSFWHGRNWKSLKQRLQRGSNASYWVHHILENRRRDRKVNASLQNLGYAVLRFWDDDIYRHPEICLRTIKKALGAKSRVERDGRK